MAKESSYMNEPYITDDGYTIIEWGVTNERGFALGKKEAEAKGFATWAFWPDTPQRLFAKHSFDDHESAFKDYKRRIDEECRLEKSCGRGGLPLPRMCLTVEPSSGDLICIKRGHKGCYASDWNKPGDREHNQNTADSMNERWGVSVAQEQAMFAGSLFGWDTPAADPRSYSPDGTPIKPTRKKPRAQER